MNRIVTNIKDLVIQTLTNGPEIKSKADNGDAQSCFQMGMINLLGINTPIDFKKASSFFSNQSLVDDSTANRLIGFIDECEGDFSSAFAYYAKASGKDNNRPLYNKVFEERRNILSFFRSMGLPNTVLNKKLSEILDNYVKGGDSKVDAVIMIATICNDESSCIEVAQHYFDMGDIYSAKKWLLKGNVDSSHPLCISVMNKLTEVENKLISSKKIEVVELEGESLLESIVFSFADYSNVKDACETNAKVCKQEWMNVVSQTVQLIMKALEEEEAERQRKLQEEEAERQRKLQVEEAERQRKLQEEEAGHPIKSNEKEVNHYHEAYGKILNVMANNFGCLAARSFDGDFQNAWDKDNEIIDALFTDNFDSTIGIYIHCHLMLNGFNNKTCKLYLKFEPSNGGSLIEGTVSLTPNNDKTEWKDLQINLGCFKFGLTKDGLYFYEANISLFDNMNNLLDTSTFPITIDFIHHRFKDNEIKVVH